jgi:vacuolar-type H+-ATPase subunit F/Vma7
MGAVVVIGEPALVGGYALAGAVVMPADGPAEALRAWQVLPADVSLVILTAAAAQAVPDELRSAGPFSAVMPG